MKQAPHNYQLVPTEDGSYTLHSENYQESCHSLSGAIEETDLHYIKGCQIQDKLQTNSPLFILEVGFGVGIGVERTFKALMHVPHAKVEMTSLEIDPELVWWVAKNNPFFKDLKETQEGFSLDLENFFLTIVIGDARKTIHNTPNKFHAIYQDAFSPKRNTVLWTVEWFNDLRNKSDQSCLLSTYSASQSIRKSLLKAGWRITEGEKFGQKRTSTRASLTGESDQKILEKLNHSSIEPLYDKDLTQWK